MVVPSHPESAERILHNEDKDTDNLALSNAELQMQSPVVEEEGADDALRHIVGHAEFAVGYE